MLATHLGTSGVRHLTETVGVKADQFFIGQHRETKRKPIQIYTDQQFTGASLPNGSEVVSE